MQITPLTAADVPAAATFIARLNSDPTQHTPYLDFEPAEIMASIERLVPPPPDAGVVAWEADQIVGVMLIDQDTTLGRTWLNGPLVDDADWSRLADELYAAVLPFVAPEIHEHELYFDLRNVNGCSFAERHGFGLYNEAAILNFERSALAQHPHIAPVELTADHHPVFAQLHEETFPRTYSSAEQIIASLDEHHKVFTVSAEGELQGYIYVKVEPEFGTGYIDFLAIAEAARGRGLGRQLLVTALHWMFSFPAVERVSLTLITSNTVAQQLYQSAGFECERVTRAYRKQIQAPQSERMEEQ